MSTTLYNERHCAIFQKRFEKEIATLFVPFLKRFLCNQRNAKGNFVIFNLSSDLEKNLTSFALLEIQ